MNRQQIIEQKLHQALSPVHLQVVNETHKHNVAADAESHYQVIAVSAQFSGKPLLQRHRMVNAALAEELAAGIHALALHTMTPEEWSQKNGHAPDSPPCLGGGAK
ncbi:BolA family protein [Thiolapillus sp.]